MKAEISVIAGKIVALQLEILKGKAMGSLL
jgi:hypothetical protein